MSISPNRNIDPPNPYTPTHHFQTSRVPTFTRGATISEPIRASRGASSQAPASHPPANDPTFPLFSRLPVEIQVRIFTEALREPGIQFFAVTGRKGGTMDLASAPGVFWEGADDGDDGGDDEDTDEGTSSVATARALSVHRERALIAQSSRAARVAWLAHAARGMVSPRTFGRADVAGSAGAVTVDGASDVVYLKFCRKRASRLGLGLPLRSSPPSWTSKGNKAKRMAGLRRVAVELDPWLVRACPYVPADSRGERRGCAACSWPFHDHEDVKVHLLVVKYAYFLRLFGDLEEVLLAIPCDTNGASKSRRKVRYLAKGEPVARLRKEMLKRRLVPGDGLSFNSGAATLAEITNRQILNKMHHFADALQKSYVQRKRPPTPTKEKEEERMEVEFKMVYWKIAG